MLCGKVERAEVDHMRAFAILFLSLSPRARLVFVGLVLVLIYCVTR